MKRRGAGRGLTVEAINLPKRIARLSNGVIVPITSLYDSDGQQTDDIDEAVQFVCGSDTLQAWFNGPTDAFGN